MTKWISASIFLIAIAVAMGCSKNNSSSSDTAATTPCTQPGCATPSWASYPGFAPYNYGSGTGFCGCNNGYLPAYSGGQVGCVNTAYVPASPVYYNMPAIWASVGITGPISGGGLAPYEIYPTRYNPYATQQSLNNLSYYYSGMPSMTAASCTQSAVIACYPSQGFTGNPACNGGSCMTVGSNPNIGICAQ